MPTDDQILNEQCFKHDCRAAIATWELDHSAPPEESFPNGLCLGHAQAPDRTGTIDQPTLVR